MTTKEELLYKSRLAEQAERYDDMKTWMKQVADNEAEMSIEERNLLSVAYKNVIGSKRASWRIISQLENKEEEKAQTQKDEDKDRENLKLIREYKAKVEKELRDTCNEVLTVLDNIIEKTANINTGSSEESQVFYHKMIGDYNRYLAEFSTAEKRKEAAENSAKSYEKAQKIAAQDLPSTHPIRLGLALNYSVFFYEIQNNSAKACELAKQAFDAAVAELDTLNEESYKDSTLIMQLLRDNLTLWTSDTADDQVALEDIEQGES